MLRNARTLPTAVRTLEFTGTTDAHEERALTCPASRVVPGVRHAAPASGAAEILTLGQEVLPWRPIEYEIRRIDAGVFLGAAANRDEWRFGNASDVRWPDGQPAAAAARHARRSESAYGNDTGATQPGAQHRQRLEIVSHFERPLSGTSRAPDVCLETPSGEVAESPARKRRQDIPRSRFGSRHRVSLGQVFASHLVPPTARAACQLGVGAQSQDGVEMTPPEPLRDRRR